jgi:hypothetical protein
MDLKILLPFLRRSKLPNSETSPPYIEEAPATALLTMQE